VHAGSVQLTLLLCMRSHEAFECEAGGPCKSWPCTHLVPDLVKDVYALLHLLEGAINLRLNLSRGTHFRFAAALLASEEPLYVAILNLLTREAGVVNWEWTGCVIA